MGQRSSRRVGPGTDDAEEETHERPERRERPARPREKSMKAARAQGPACPKYKSNIYTFGDAEYGQLGTGSHDQRVRPAQVEPLCDRKVLLAACGDYHTILFAAGSEAFAAGFNEFGQLGLGFASGNVTTFRSIPAFSGSTIGAIGCGGNHTVVATTAPVAAVYSFGWASSGQLGIGATRDSAVATPHQVEALGSGADVTHIACGRQHTLVVKGGVVYAFGDNEFGQLGVGDKNARLSPCPVALPKSPSGAAPEVVAVACGATHSLILAAGVGVYAVGDGRVAQLGLGFTGRTIHTPILLDSLPGCASLVAAGKSHSACVVDGVLFTWGSGRAGQLGHGGGELTVLQPRVVRLGGEVKGVVPPAVTAVACGASHTLVTTSAGAFVAFGSGGEGQLGLGRLVSHPTPTRVDFFAGANVVAVAGGVGHSVAVVHALPPPPVRAVPPRDATAGAAGAGVPASQVLLGEIKRRADFTQWLQASLLGAGSSGRVYMGLLTGDFMGVMVAVKVIELSSVTSPRQVDGIMKEIALMKDYQHENIVQFLGTRVDHVLNHLHIFMEYVPGGSLLSLIQRTSNRLPEELVRHYTRQILVGLDYLHGAGVVHRDIKADNILVSEGGVAKLADFGCSRRVSDLVSGGGEAGSTFVGTPCWMAPEVIRDDESATARGGHGTKADIWSLGCTVVEMVSGKPPWPEFRSMWGAIYHIANATGPPPGIPSDISPALLAFLLRCFERDATARASAADLLRDPFLTGGGGGGGGGGVEARAPSRGVVSHKSSAATLPADPEGAHSTP